MTVLQRNPRARFARAGFPSKVAESLLLGCPVMANLSSDLADYLSASNSVILESERFSALVDGVKTAMDLRFDRDAVVEQAEAWFTPEAVATRLGPFLVNAHARAWQSR